MKLGPYHIIELIFLYETTADLPVLVSTLPFPPSSGSFPHLRANMPSRRTPYDSDSDDDNSDDSDFEYDPEDDVDLEIEHEKQALRLELRAPFEPMFSKSQLEKLKNEPANFELSPSKHKRPNNQARLDASMFAPIPSTTVLSKFLRRPSPPTSEPSSPREESMMSVASSVRPNKARKLAELEVPQTASIQSSKGTRYINRSHLFSDSSSDEENTEVSATSSLPLPPRRRGLPGLDVPRPPTSNNTSSSTLRGPPPSSPDTPITKKLSRLHASTREAVDRARASS